MPELKERVTTRSIRPDDLEHQADGESMGKQAKARPILIENDIVLQLTRSLGNFWLISSSTSDALVKGPTMFLKCPGWLSYPGQPFLLVRDDPW